MAMSTGATTRIEIRCEADASGTTRLRVLRASGLLRARALPCDGDVARVALVQTAASLLSGDDIRLDVHCGVGCRLELVEVAGMVAHDVRGGETARYDVRVALGAGARMSWAGQPLTLAGGCDLRRKLSASLAAGSALLWRDTLILGRTGETTGRLVSCTTVHHDTRELHSERLDTGDLALLSSCVVAGAGARVIDTLALYGERADDGLGLQLAGPGTVWPLPGPSLAATAARLDPAQARWRTTLLHTTTGLREDALDDVRLAV
jgi:urease accessory protein